MRPRFCAATINNYSFSRKLKGLYRAVAKQVHPDLASDEADRHMRAGLMTEANAAYERRDLDALGRILEEYERNTEGVWAFAVADANECYKRGVSLWNKRKFTEAVQWFERGLQLDPNHAAQQFHLGLAYYQGLGVPQTDCTLAAIWWRKAAEQGYAEAQNNLGRLYEEGEGIEHDYAGAAYWYRKAAEQNHVTSQFNLAVMYELGHGVPQDLAQAATWYRKAAEQGYAPAQLNLAVMCELGQGMPQDFAEAAAWYREAAESGDDTARNALWDLLEKLEAGVPFVRNHQLSRR